MKEYRPTQPAIPTQILLLVVAAGAVLFGVGAAHAQLTSTWTGASGQPANYANGGNWNSGLSPVGNERGLFLNTSALNLTSPGNISAGQLQLSGSTVSFVSANAMSYTSAISLFLNSSSLFLRTNSAADSTTFNTNIVSLGVAPSLTRSTLTLDEGFGGTVSLTATNSVIVGGGTQATLAVQNGATLSTGSLQIANIFTATETSRVLVSGTNALVAVTNQIVIGVNQSAELSIQNRGVVTAGQVVIGQNMGSGGTVNISNLGSQFNVSNSLAVGHNGAGTLNLFSGAIVTSSSGTVGNVTGNGVANVDGAGSRWNIVNLLTIGSPGTATGRLNLTGGGEASIGILDLRSNGRIDITDSTLTLGAIFSGNAGTVNFNSGTINITNLDLELGQTVLLPTATSIVAGKNVNITNNLTIANGDVLTLSGGGFTAGGLFILGGGQLVVTDNRTLTSSLVNNGGSVVGPAGTSRLTFSGSVLGQGSFMGNTRFDGGYTPGNGFNPITASLDDVVFGGTNTLNLFAGFDGNQSDRLSFASLGTLGGTLNLDFIGGYTPQAGDSFDLFDGPATGAFSILDFQDVSGLGLIYDTSQLYTTGIVSLAAAVPEPGSSALVALGLCGLNASIRRQRRARNLGRI